MAFKRYNGYPNIQSFQKKASTAMNPDSVLALDTSGLLVPATATTYPTAIAGVSQAGAIASTDLDYAAQTQEPVEVPSPREDWFLADVGTGSATQALVGTRCDLKDDVSVDVTATARNVVRIEKVISATKVVVSFPGINAA